MELVYIYHSGFALLGDGYTVIMDYYRDTEDKQAEAALRRLMNEQPEEPVVAPEQGKVHDELLHRPGKLYVLASRFHPDHFNKEVLDWKTQRPDIIYIFSKDILKHRRAQKEDAVWLKKGEEYADETLSVRAFGSTDVGVSFLIEVENKKFFHAGDLNNWHWMEESTEQEWKGYCTDAFRARLWESKCFPCFGRNPWNTFYRNKVSRTDYKNLKKYESKRKI